MQAFSKMLIKKLMQDKTSFKEAAYKQTFTNSLEALNTWFINFMLA